jgi:hypothetical protein
MSDSVNELIIGILGFFFFFFPLSRNLKLIDKRWDYTSQGMRNKNRSGIRRKSSMLLTLLCFTFLLPNLLKLLKADKRWGRNCCWGFQWVTMSHRLGPGLPCWSGNNRVAATSKLRLWSLPGHWSRSREASYTTIKKQLPHGLGAGVFFWSIYKTTNINVYNQKWSR